MVFIGCTSVPENVVLDENGEPVTKTRKHNDHNHDEYITTDTKEGQLLQAHYDSIKAVHEAKEKIRMDSMVDNKPKQASNINRYIGKLIFRPEWESDFKKLDLSEGAVISAWVGCECDEKVGKFKDTPSSIDKNNNDGKVDIVISGDLLRKLMAYDKNTLQHVFLKYTLNKDGDRTVDEIGFNYLDQIPLEKVTLYTLDKWNYGTLVNKDSLAHAMLVADSMTQASIKTDIEKFKAISTQPSSVSPAPTGTTDTNKNPPSPAIRRR